MKVKQKFILVFIILSYSYVSAQNSYTDSLKQKLAASKKDTNQAILLGKLSSEYMWFYADTGRMFAEEGLQLSKKLNYKYGEARCSINLFVCLLQEGDFTNALDFGFKALSIFQNIRDTENIIFSYGVLMICYREQGDYKQALVQGYKAK